MVIQIANRVKTGKSLCCLTATACEGRRPCRDLAERDRDPGKRTNARLLLSRSTCPSVALLRTSRTSVLVCPPVCSRGLLGLSGKIGFFFLFLPLCSGSRCRCPRPCVCSLREGIALRVPLSTRVVLCPGCVVPPVSGCTLRDGVAEFEAGHRPAVPVPLLFASLK